MNRLDLPPTAQLPNPAPPPEPLDPNDVGTVRNLACHLGVPADAHLEPVGLPDPRWSSDRPTAVRLADALERFPAVGSRFAGFDLVAVLGRGTFGRVYLARQGELADRFVALKVSADLAGESRTLARLQHTNIVPIYSVHCAAPYQAVCMPFFGTTTLGHLLHRFHKHATLPETGRQLLDTLKVLAVETEVAPVAGATMPGTAPRPGDPPSVLADADPHRHLARGPARSGGPLETLREVSYPDAVCWIGARLADGLEHAHSHGILHNDLKPANVLITDDGQPMLLDFGVADDLRLRATTPGATIGGTLPYMAPEHLRSVRDRVFATDTRSDVYALGLILFELLTGAHPFRNPTGTLEEELPRMIAEREQPPPRVRPRNAKVSRGLEAIVRKCLEPDPARRYQSAADLRDDLDRHRSHLPLLHARVPVRERLRKWAWRHPRLTSNLSIATATAVVLCVCLVGVFAASARAARSEAAVTARLFDDDLKAAHYLLGARTPDSATVDGGIAKCQAALARYGLPNDPNWESRSEFRRLPEGEQERIRKQVTDACLLLARGHSLRARPGDGEAGPLGNALKANELAARVSGGSPPRAVWEQRAELLRRAGKPEDAERSAKRAGEAPLGAARDYFLSGTEALFAGRFRDALPLLRKATDFDPGDFAAHMSLGLCHDGLAQFADASACYTTAIALRPDHPGGYHARGLVSLRLRDPARARADLDKVAGMTPDVPEVYLDRALAHQGLRDHAAALRDLDRALELGAPRMRALSMRARLKELSGDKDGAKADLAEALKLGGSDDVSLVARGLARVAADPAGAVADFNDALEFNPRSLAAMQNKAFALSRAGKNAEAVRTLDGLLEVYPDFVPARAGRGVIHARLGHEKEAVADAEEALKRDQSPANAYQVAGIYALLDKARPGARAEAIRLLTAALRRGFGHEYVEADKDLDPIRGTPEFKRVLETVRVLRGDRRQ